MLWMLTPSAFVAICRLNIVRNTLVVLIALAKRPEGRVTPDELDDEVARLIAESDEKLENPEQSSR